MKSVSMSKEGKYTGSMVYTHKGHTYTLDLEVGGMVPAMHNRFGFLPYLRGREDEIHDRVVRVYRDGVEVLNAHTFTEACDAIEKMTARDEDPAEKELAELLSDPVGRAVWESRHNFEA